MHQRDQRACEYYTLRDSKHGISVQGIQMAEWSASLYPVAEGITLKGKQGIVD
jgi:hypothetical protein